MSNLCTTVHCGSLKYASHINMNVLHASFLASSGTGTLTDSVCKAHCCKRFHTRSLANWANPTLCCLRIVWATLTLTLALLETDRHMSRRDGQSFWWLSSVCQAANSLLTGTWSGITNAVSVLLSHNASSLDILFAIFSTQHATTRMNTNNEQLDVLIDSNSKQQLSVVSASTRVAGSIYFSTSNTRWARALWYFGEHNRARTERETAGREKERTRATIISSDQSSRLRIARWVKPFETIYNNVYRTRIVGFLFI